MASRTTNSPALQRKKASEQSIFFISNYHSRFLLEFERAPNSLPLPPGYVPVWTTINNCSWATKQMTTIIIAVEQSNPKGFRNRNGRRKKRNKRQIKIVKVGYACSIPSTDWPRNVIVNERERDEISAFLFVNNGACIWTHMLSVVRWTGPTGDN